MHRSGCRQAHQGRAWQPRWLPARLQQRGNGEVGPAWRVIPGAESAVYSPRRLHPRLLQTGLGTLPSTRLSYSRPGAARLPPPDPALPLPARSFSYALQKRMPEAAVPGTFRAARERIADLRGAPVPLRRIEEILRDAPEDFDTFYARRTPEPGSHTGSIPGAGADGTGIALSKPEGAQRSVRRPTGQKANRQKRATVAAGFPPAPWMGTPEQAVESLFGPNRSVVAAGKPAPPPAPKRVGAGWTQGQAAVLAAVAHEGLRRALPGHQSHLALTGGGRARPIPAVE